MKIKYKKGIKTENEFTTKADELLAQLPKGNKSLLCRLLNLCQKIIANSSVRFFFFFFFN